MLRGVPADAWTSPGRGPDTPGGPVWAGWAGVGEFKLEGRQRAQRGLTDWRWGPWARGSGAQAMGRAGARVRWSRPPGSESKIVLSAMKMR